MLMRLLGTGNAPQIPVYGCRCRSCARARVDENFKRRPTSAEIQTATGRFLLDAGRTDLADWVDPETLSGVILTHYHMDHVAGLFHMRWGVCDPIPVYGPPDLQGADDLFDHPGCLDFSHHLVAYQATQLTEDLTVIPVPIKHSRLTFGYILKGHRESLVYLSDCDGVGPESARMIRDANPNAVIVDCSFPPETGRHHLSLDRAHALASDLQAPWLYLTHIGHDLSNYLLDHPLDPEGRLVLSHDGLTFHFD